MNKPPVIGIIGGTIWGNRGAESMLVTTIGMLRQSQPDAQFVVFSYSPKKDRKLIQDQNIQVVSAKPTSLVLRVFPFVVLAWLLRLVGITVPGALLTNVVRALRRCDMLLDIGGISFVDGREIFLPFNILTIWPAMMLKIPVVKLAQALGPFRNPLNRAAARIFLPRCQAIFARGDITAENLVQIRLRNVTRAADIAFLYDSRFSLSVENEEQVQELQAELARVKAQGKRIIMISPSSLVYEKAAKKGKDHVGELLQLVRDLDDGSTHFLFLANSTKEGSAKPRNNDIFVLDLLMQRALTTLLPEEFAIMHWVNWDVNTASLRKLMGMGDLLITSRFHAMVSGLSLCVPTLVIGWSHKYQETLADFGMQRYAADVDRGFGDLLALARELLEQGQAVRAQLSARLGAVRELSRVQFQYLESLLH